MLLVELAIGCTKTMIAIYWVSFFSPPDISLLPGFWGWSPWVGGDTLATADDSIRCPNTAGHQASLATQSHRSFLQCIRPRVRWRSIARGFVARQAFDAPTTSYFVIAGERILGLATLGIVFGLGVLLGPRIPSIEDAAVWVAIPVFLSLIGFGVALIGRRIRHWWRSAPELERPGLVGLAALSL